MYVEHIYPIYFNFAHAIMSLASNYTYNEISNSEIIEQYNFHTALRISALCTPPANVSTRQVLFSQLPRCEFHFKIML